LCERRWQRIGRDESIFDADSDDVDVGGRARDESEREQRGAADYDDLEGGADCRELLTQRASRSRSASALSIAGVMLNMPISHV
jgi:hypothetical protein